MKQNLFSYPFVGLHFILRQLALCEAVSHFQKAASGDGGEQQVVTKLNQFYTGFQNLFHEWILRIKVRG